MICVMVVMGHIILCVCFIDDLLVFWDQGSSIKQNGLVTSLEGSLTVDGERNRETEREMYY